MLRLLLTLAIFSLDGAVAYLIGLADGE